MKLINLIFLSILLFSCSQEQVIEEEKVILPFEFQEISTEKKIEIALSKEYLQTLKLSDSSISYIQEYYTKRNFIPRWINDSTLSDIGLQLRNNFEKSYSFGLPTGRILAENGENLEYFQASS